MKRRIFFAILCFIIFLQLVSAIDTEIKIDTLSNHTLRLIFLSNEGAISTIENIKLNSGEDGTIPYIFSYAQDSFNVGITLLKDGNRLFYELIEDVTSGETLYARLIPGAIEITKDYQELEVEVPVTEESAVDETTSVIINESSEEVNESDEETPTVSGGVVDGEKQISEEGFKFSNFFKFFRISGFVSSEDGKSSSMKFVFYGIGFVFLLAIVFFVFKMKKNSGVGGKFKNDEDELGDAQRKIDEAEQEIREVRRKRVGF